MHRFPSLIRAVSLTCLLAIPAHAQESAASDQAHAEVQKENAQQTLVHEAARLLGEGDATQALVPIGEAISGYEKRFATSKGKVYSVRNATETLMYMAEAAQAGTDAIAVEAEYGYAYYLKAYALIELQRNEEALTVLHQAIALSPRNAQFLSELGNIYQNAKDWPQALDAYQDAEAAAELSPENVKDKELARALRGIGYVFIETGRYDEAEAIYLRCLKIDPNDATSAKELEYVRKLRKTREGESSPTDSPVP